MKGNLINALMAIEISAGIKLAVILTAVIGVILIMILAFYSAWKPVSWAVGFLTFIFLQTKLQDVNPIAKLAIFGKYGAGVQNAVGALFYAFVSVVVAMFVFTLLTSIFGPKDLKYYVRREDLEDEDVYDEDDDFDINEMELDDDYDGYNKRRDMNPILRTMIAAVNIAVIFIFTISLALVICNVTYLRDHGLEQFYDHPLIKKVWDKMLRYSIDAAFIGIITGLAWGGYKKGFYRGVRVIIVSALYLLAIGLGFWLPFSKLVQESDLLGFIASTSKFYTSILPDSLPEGLSDTLGKVLCGVTTCIEMSLIIAILDFIFKRVFVRVSTGKVVRFIDGFLCSILMAAIGLVFCAVIALLLYAFDYYEVFEASKLFAPDSPIIGGLYELFDEFLAPLLKKLPVVGK